MQYIKAAHNPVIGQFDHRCFRVASLVRLYLAILPQAEVDGIAMLKTHRAWWFIGDTRSAYNTVVAPWAMGMAHGHGAWRNSGLDLRWDSGLLGTTNEGTQCSRCGCPVESLRPDLHGITGNAKRRYRRASRSGPRTHHSPFVT